MKAIDSQWIVPPEEASKEKTIPSPISTYGGIGLHLPGTSQLYAHDFINAKDFRKIQIPGPFLLIPKILEKAQYSIKQDPVDYSRSMTYLSGCERERRWKVS